jgi:hypothetical protein
MNQITDRGLELRKRLQPTGRQRAPSGGVGMPERP